jgi:hypothetical protein
MNQASTLITAVNYNGRLHLGYGYENGSTHCLGSSIKTYRNPIAKFFSKIFGFGIDVEVGGKIRCLNKVSLKSHLQSIGLGDAKLEEVSKIGYRTLIETIQEKDSAKLKISQEKLGANFSNTKRMKLFTKMIKQLDANNTQAVMKLIRKGAYIDREFYKYNNKLLIDKKETEALLTAYSIRDTSSIVSYTPMAMATEKANQVLAYFISNNKGSNFTADMKKQYNYTFIGNNRYKAEERNAERVYFDSSSRFSLI